GVNSREVATGACGPPPVGAVLPVRDEVLHVGEAAAEGPLGAGGLIGPAHAGQPLAQVGEGGVGNLDSEGRGRHQNTGRSMYEPQTFRRRAAISPSVARAFTSSMVTGIRLVAGSRASRSRRSI